MSSDLSVRMGEITFEHPVMNAAGTAKTLQDVERLARTSVSGIVVGSGTVEARQGNPGKVLHYEPGFSLNSLGLPNPGMVYYEKALPKMLRVARNEGKRLVFSAAGFSPLEYGRLSSMAADCGVDAVELNLGCPNVWSESGQQKPIACFKPALVDEIFAAVAVAEVAPVSTWAKISPCSNPFDLELFATCVSRQRYPFLEAVTGVNTFANGSAFDESDRNAIEAADGFAGLAGPPLKCIALGHMRKLRQLLPYLMFVGVGGVSHGRDVKDLLTAGASLVQIGTAFIRDGARPDYGVFERVLTEYTDLL